MKWTFEATEAQVAELNNTFVILGIDPPVVEEEPLYDYPNRQSVANALLAQVLQDAGLDFDQQAPQQHRPESVLNAADGALNDHFLTDNEFEFLDSINQECAYAAYDNLAPEARAELQAWAQEQVKQAG